MSKITIACVFLLAAAGIARAQQPPDRAAAEQAMIDADKAFCQAVVDHDRDRFGSLIADDATFGGGATPLVGRSAIVSAWSPYLTPGGPTITWTPRHAEALVGADVGYTRGSYERHATTREGKPVVQRGEYLTVWHKQPDGAWRVVFDTGSVQP